MGTNYYVQQPEDPEPLHLGKMSAGWHFTFRADPMWDPDRAFAEWVIRAAIGTIKDEYDKEVPFGFLMSAIMLRSLEKELHVPSGSYEDHGFYFVEGEFS